MALSIYNTLSGQKEPFAPLVPNHVRAYVCGLTVYDFAHIGHARTYVAFDTIVRYLRRQYERVTLVRNFTDVDDKIIKRAAERGESPQALSERFVETFLADMARLGVAPADVQPRVTAHIPEIVSLIETLVREGSAYASGGDVYYAVEKFANYGRLGRRALADMEAGARVEIGEHKRHPMDFALWKAAKPGEPHWDSPWGKGRPGWHIECSAMSMKYLGPTFDIHGGGKDLIFPHHENEIAQSEAATHQPFARFWLHSGFVNIDNEKMSKSLGNFFTIREVLDKFDPQTLRYYLLTTHYRSPINFADQGLAEAESRVKYVYETLARLRGKYVAGDASPPYREGWVDQIMPRFVAAMDDDFNTAKALGDLSEVFRLVNEILDRPADASVDERTLRAIDKAIRDIGGVLGLFVDQPVLVLRRIADRKATQKNVNAAEVNRLIAERAAARSAKDFVRADAVRQQLLDMGVVIKDSPTGTSWEIA